MTLIKQSEYDNAIRMNSLAYICLNRTQISLIVQIEAANAIRMNSSAYICVISVPFSHA